MTTGSLYSKSITPPPKSVNCIAKPDLAFVLPKYPCGILKPILVDIALTLEGGTTSFSTE